MALLVLLTLVSAAVGGGLVAWQLGRDDSGSSPARAAAPAGWPEPGASRALTVVRSGGVLEVTHWITSKEPLDELELALPQTSSAPASTPSSTPDPDGSTGSGKAARAPRLEAADVRVEADGLGSVGPTTITRGRAVYSFAAATRIKVTYRLKGAVEISTSAPGRGLVSTTALDVSATQPRDTRLVRSQAVLSMACAASATAELAPCGESDGSGQWRVRLDSDASGARVVAVVTVPG